MISEKFMFLALFIGLIGEASYFIATLRGQTKPNRVSWFLWAIAPFLAVAGALDEGVGLQVLLTFMVGFGPACIFVASFINPNAFWKITRLDIACGGLSICGLFIWLITQEGTVAIVAGIAADGLAGIPTLIKAYRYPRTEHSLIFWIAGFNALITLFTIDHWNFAHYGFPLYVLVFTWLLAALITFRIGERSSTLTNNYAGK